MSFKRSYEKSPTVLVTAKHSIKGGKVATECNGIVSWIEVIQTAVIKEKNHFTIPKVIEARYLFRLNLLHLHIKVPLRIE